MNQRGGLHGFVAMRPGAGLAPLALRQAAHFIVEQGQQFACCDTHFVRCADVAGLRRSLLSSLFRHSPSLESPLSLPPLASR